MRKGFRLLAVVAVICMVMGCFTPLRSVHAETGGYAVTEHAADTAGTVEGTTIQESREGSDVLEITETATDTAADISDSADTTGTPDPNDTDPSGTSASETVPAEPELYVDGWIREYPTGLESPSVECLDDYECIEDYYAAEGIIPAAVYDISRGRGGINTAEENGGWNSYVYDSFESDAEKELFAGLYSSLKAFAGSDKYKQNYSENDRYVSVEYTLDGQSLTQAQIDAAVTGILYGAPEFYWLDHRLGYHISQSKLTILYEMDIEYLDYATRKATDDAIAEVAPAWISELNAIKNSGQSDALYLTALKAHDLIIGAIDYARDSQGEPESAAHAHSIAGVFTGDGVVCEGYAKCFEYLMDAVGMDNIYIVGTATTSGTGGGGGHAWNAVRLAADGDYALIDATWDDPNEDTIVGLNDCDYQWFAMPSSLFKSSHTPQKKGVESFYALPDFSDDAEISFFGKFKCYNDEGFSTDDEAQSFADQVIANRYLESDLVHLVFPYNNNNLSMIVSKLEGLDPDAEETYRSTQSPYGVYLRYVAPLVESPAESIELNPANLEIAVSATGTITAVLNEGSDDKVKWEISNPRIAKLSVNGNTAKITGRRNGEVTVKATTMVSGKSATAKVKVGTGGSGAEAIIWQNGDKDHKTVKLTGLNASSYKDAKGKTKKGKIVWIASDEPIDVEFDTEGHKLSSKPKPEKGKVNNKGIVTAKAAGTLYVYCCDTGSCKAEEHVVDILAAPSKVFCTNNIIDITQLDGDDSEAKASVKKALLKKAELNAAYSGRVYISGYVKAGVADVDCEYTVKLVKTEQSGFASVTDVVQTADGQPYFTVNAKNFDQSKQKTASVKVEIACKQSGKKTSMTVVIGNPVTGMDTELIGTSTSLAKKKNTVKFKLKPETALDIEKTTDKIKVLVGLSSITLNEKGKPEADKGATVKVKFDAKTLSVTLTASKDAGTPAVVKAACTNAVSKKTKLFELAVVDENGNVTLK